jgi:hypothetical protein
LPDGFSKQFGDFRLTVDGDHLVIAKDWTSFSTAQMLQRFFSAVETRRHRRTFRLQTQNENHHFNRLLHILILHQQQEL